MPKDVGIITKITLYASYDGKCKDEISSGSVMRCSYSKPNDYIYRYDGKEFGCSNGFCGMD